MSGISRRTFGSALLGSIATGTAVYALTNKSQATAVQVDELDVASTQRDVSDTVTALTLSVNGTVQWDSEKVPTKVVLRLEAKTTDGNQYNQLDAQDWRNSLSKQQSAKFSFTDVDVLQLPNLDATDLTPGSIGDSTTTKLDIRLTMTVFSDGTLLKEHMVEDTATVELTKAKPDVNATISATGNLTVS